MTAEFLKTLLVINKQRYSLCIFTLPKREDVGPIYYMNTQYVSNIFKYENTVLNLIDRHLMLNSI